MEEKAQKNYFNTKDEKFQYAFVYRSLNEHYILGHPKKRKKEHDLINNKRHFDS